MMWVWRFCVWGSNMFVSPRRCLKSFWSIDFSLNIVSLCLLVDVTHHDSEFEEQSLRSRFCNCKFRKHSLGYLGQSNFSVNTCSKETVCWRLCLSVCRWRCSEFIFSDGEYARQIWRWRRLFSVEQWGPLPGQTEQDVQSAKQSDNSNWGQEKTEEEEK